MARVLWVGCSGLSLAAFLVILVRFLATGPADRLAQADSLASVLSLVLSIAFGVLSVWAAVRATHSGETALLDRAAVEVARVVDRQWRDEAYARGLTGSEPLLVTWSQTDRPVVADAGPTPWAPDAACNGVVAESVALWRTLPQGELVIIGAPGAGKTSMALLLVIGLLAEASPADPVPVLIGLSFWDGEKPLPDWIAETVAKQVDRPRVDPGVIGQLMRRRRLLPVLDGLDELASERRVQALKGLHRLSADAIPFVLTSRAEEFEQSVLASGEPLARAAVVELEPVAATTALRYLVAGQLDGRRRWSEVSVELETHRDGLAAKVLSTPLMIFLARAAFRSLAGEPRRILACQSMEEAEQLLFDTYFDSVYSEPRRPTARDARRWMSFLARDAHKYGLSNLDDLRLVDAVGLKRWLLGFARAALTGGLAAVVVGSLFWLAAGQVLAIILGTTIGLGTFVCGLDSDDLVNLIGLFVAAGLAVAAVMILLGDAIGWLLLLGLVVGVPVLAGLAVMAVGAKFPGRRDERAGLTETGFYIMAGPVLLSAFWLALLLQLFTVILSQRVQSGFDVARQWTLRMTIRCGAFARGQLPLRLMRFLRDAHDRGVLRRSATRYELRHDRLHHYLAGAGHDR